MIYISINSGNHISNCTKQFLKKRGRLLFSEKIYTNKAGPFLTLPLAFDNWIFRYCYTLLILKHHYGPVPLNAISVVHVTGSLEVIPKTKLFSPDDVALKATLIVKVLLGLIVLAPLPPAIVNMEASVPVIVELEIR